MIQRNDFFALFAHQRNSRFRVSPATAYEFDWYIIGIEAAMKKAILFLFALLLAACSTASPTPLATPSAKDIEAGEAAVYAALFQAMYPDQSIVLMDRTATGYVRRSEVLNSVIRSKKVRQHVAWTTASRERRLHS